MHSTPRFLAALGASLIVGGLLASACDDHEGLDSFHNVPVVTTSTVTGSQGGSMPYNPCACMETALNEADNTEPCLACWLRAVAPGADCEQEAADCHVSAQCELVIDCVDQCDADGSADLTCLGNCIYPPTSSPGLELYLDWVECMCRSCASECNSYGDTECQPGTGGSGGSGGSGNSGGSGGESSGGSGGTGGTPAGGSGGAAGSG